MTEFNYETWWKARPMLWRMWMVFWWRWDRLAAALTGRPTVMEKRIILSAAEERQKYEREIKRLRVEVERLELVVASLRKEEP